MKYISFCLVFTCLIKFVLAQHVGIGIANPQNKLQVAGNLLVSAPVTSTNSAPTPAQTLTLVNGTTVSIGGTDSTARIYDPGGPSGNYLPNLSASNIFYMGDYSNTGMELTLESVGLGTGDSLIIKENSDADDAVLLAVGNGYSTTGKWTFAGSTLYIQFKSNADANTGSGFSLHVKRLFQNPATATDIAGFGGNSFFFDTKKAVLRSGRQDNRPRGEYSVAFGQTTAATASYSMAVGYAALASGTYSVAMGYGAEASGDASFATGNGKASGLEAIATGTSIASANWAFASGESCNASAYASTAIGSQNQASGSVSLALGQETIASGIRSATMGYKTRAQGVNSTAMGVGTLSRGFAGTVVGMYNNAILFSGQSSVADFTPLFTVGNGDDETNTSNALLVRKDGRVGIGSNSPATKLHIDNGTDASYSDNSGYFVIGDINSTNIVFDNNEMMARNDGASSTLFLQNDGGAFEIGGTAAKPGGGSWSATSDARLKQHVQDYKDGLQQILKINPVEFNYNNLSGYDTSKQYVGVLAQELKEVAPYMVDTFKKDNTDYLKVDNTAMTYMLINAVKEQQKEMEALKAGMKEQQKEMEELKRLVKELLKK